MGLGHLLVVATLFFGFHAMPTFHKLYNWTWLYTGYHAEHHYRPKVHWTKMTAPRNSIRAEQVAQGVHVMGFCHALGFLVANPPQYARIGRGKWRRKMSNSLFAKASSDSNRVEVEARYYAAHTESALTG
jgi:hypothetical protein